MAKVTVCVCTRGRPQMLQTCLNSLRVQTLEPLVVVCENEREPMLREMVERQGAIYVHESNLGIPQARNAALDAAFKLRTDWIAFIDDDDVADPDWVRKLVFAAEAYLADGAAGPEMHKFPDDVSRWRRRAVWRTEWHPEGTPVVRAATSNALFSRTFLRAHGIRFNEDRRFHSGEDTEFFWDIHRAGGKIVWTNCAIVTELVPPDRMTLRHHWRHSRHAGNHVVETRKLHGVDLRGLRRKAVRKIVRGAGKIVLTPVATLWMRGEKNLFRGVCDIGKGLGILDGLKGVKSHYYEEITGR